MRKEVEMTGPNKEPIAEPKELEVELEEEQEVPEDQDGEEEEAPEGEESTEEDDDQDEPENEASPGSIEDAQKSLEVELKKVREDLLDAKAKTEFLEKELDKARQEYGTGVSNLWTYQGKHIYELNETEYQEALDMLLEGAGNADTDQERKAYLTQIKECHKLRNAGATLRHQEAVIENREADQWDKEWKIVETALVKEWPQLKDDKALVAAINEKIVPIFLNRKSGSEERFLYRKLTDGFRGKDSVEEKFRYAVKVIKDLGLLKALEGKSSAVPTIGKATQSKVTGVNKTFTREQINRMSLEEFERNEKAIDEALQKKKIK